MHICHTQPTLKIDIKSEIHLLMATLISYIVSQYKVTILHHYTTVECFSGKGGGGCIGS